MKQVEVLSDDSAYFDIRDLIPGAYLLTGINDSIYLYMALNCGMK